MRLKKMMVIGFKSFADKTVLNFDEGVTCIVGPNGCGKSNIADAFRWVLGEQSARSLRGNKMNDVIFAGTTKRKPLNMAEVSLTFTDVKGKLPVDYEEVTIARRLYRSGESDYILNGNNVRLKDIQSLFFDSGIGSQAFSIFEQGKIDQVINTSPRERRSIFEEAAGIVRFLERKRESLRRLDQTTINLERVQDVTHEVENHIETLKEQAEKAKIVKENQALLETLEKTQYVSRWDQIEIKREETEKRHTTCKELLIDLNAEIEELKTKELERKQKLSHGEKQRHFQNGELFRVKGQKALAESEWKSDQETLQDSKKRELKLLEELKEIKSLNQSSKDSEAHIQHQIKELQEKLQTTEAEVKSYQAILKRKEDGMNKLRTEMQASLQERLHLSQKESRLDSEIKQNRVRLENSQQRKLSLEGKCEFLSKDLAQFVQIQETKKKQLDDTNEAFAAIKKNAETCGNKLKTIHLEIDRQQKKRDSIKKRLMEHTARQKILKKMREEQEGFSTGSKKLLQESQSSKSPLYQKVKPLYEFFKADAELAESLAMILRSYSQTLVVETFEDFDLTLEFAKAGKLQDFSLLCLEGITPAEKSAKEKKGIHQASTNAVANHFLNCVSEVQTNQDACEMLPKNIGHGIWSHEGLFFDHYHVAFFQKPNESHIFFREAELQTLEKEISSADADFQGLEKEIALLEKEKRSIHEERTELDKQLRQEELKKIEINFSLQRALSDQQRVEKEVGQREKEMSTLTDQIESVLKLLDNSQNQQGEVNQNLKRCQEEIDRVEKEIESQNSVLRVEQKSYKEKETAHRLLAEESQRLLHQANVLDIQQQERKKQEKRIEGECSQLKMVQFTIQDKSKVAQESLLKLQTLVEDLEQSHALLEIEISKEKRSLDEIDDTLKQKQILSKKYENENHQLILQIARMSSTTEALEMQLMDRYQIDLEDARIEANKIKLPLESIEKQIKGIKETLQYYGDVNMTSIEELEQHQARSIDLNQQMNDILNSKEELLKIIGQLDGDSAKLFKVTFNLIRENFRKNFSILFEGGMADLQLTGSDHILEAGIEIIAQPPGKQMKTINLLSGGEKCLTAVALLFAIFEVKPSPFCILDEIDAPLDESNVERFAKMVRHFIDQCQFLIITHNKKTMAIGDVLCGVSMEERGVSKLLSLHLGRENGKQETALDGETPHPHAEELGQEFETVSKKG